MLSCSGTDTLLQIPRTFSKLSAVSLLMWKASGSTAYNDADYFYWSTKEPATGLESFVQVCTSRQPDNQNSDAIENFSLH